MSLLHELTDRLGSKVTTRASEIEHYQRDRALLSHAEPALCVVKPHTTADVQEVARWATRHRVPIVPRGAGTGVAGGASSLKGCALLSFENMNEIRTLDTAGMYAVVEPGVLNVSLKEKACDVGLWYPPDPASFDISTLGGNVATNAGGLCCARYGVTSDYVLGLEAVRADGHSFRTGSLCRKNVAGYNLTQLLVGSEGTLAMITEITLRLVPVPEATTTIRASFDSVVAAGRAVATLSRLVRCTTLELMDAAAVRAVESYLGIQLDATGAILIAQVDESRPADATAVELACVTAGANRVSRAQNEVESEALLRARRAAFPAVEKLGTILLCDVGVPPSRLAEMLHLIEARSAEIGLHVATVAHAGDGNLHPLVVFNPNDVQEAARAKSLCDAFMTDALSLGGTITGEHGVGNLKRGALLRQLDATSVEIQHAIKRSFDPLGILNPGKIFDIASSPAPGSHSH